MFTGKFIDVNTYIKNDDRSQITNLNFQKLQKNIEQAEGNNKD